MTIWILNQASSIPGVPSDAHPSAGVCVEVNDANEVVSVTPLTQPPHLEPAPDAPTADTTVPVEQAQPEQVSAAETPE